MSSDLYASEIDDEVCGSLVLKTKPDKTLKMTVCDPSDGGIATFYLPSSKEGKEEAQKIIESLYQWLKENK